MKWWRSWRHELLPDLHQTEEQALETPASLYYFTVEIWLLSTCLIPVLDSNYFAIKLMQFLLNWGWKQSNEISLIWSHISAIYGLIIESSNSQLPFGLIVQLLQCTGVAEVRVPVPFRPAEFFRPFSRYCTKSAKIVNIKINANYLFYSYFLLFAPRISWRRASKTLTKQLEINS